MHPTHQQPGTDLYGSPADLLRCAALYLERHGWHQHGFYDGIGQPFPAADIAGALRVAVYGQRNDALTLYSPLGWYVDMALCALADFLGIADCDQTLLAWLDDANDAVTAWNDEPGRTVAQVLDAIHEAADEYDRTNNPVDYIVAMFQRDRTTWSSADTKFWTDFWAAPDTAAKQETYGDNELDHDRTPTTEGFLSWLHTRDAR